MALTKVTNSMMNSASASVLDFGATGDGVTDDSDAIQACINYVQANTNSGVHGSYSPHVGPGTVFFPEGAYKVTKPLVISYGICIEGDGHPEYTYGARLFQVTADTDLIRYSTLTGGGTFGMRNMVLQTTAAVGTGHLLSISRNGSPFINSVKIKNCVFAQPQDKAIYIDGDDTLIEGCTFDVSGKSGHFIGIGDTPAGNTASNVRILNNDFYNANNSCVKIANVEGLIISGNVVSQPNTATKTTIVFDATGATTAKNINITNNVVKGPRTFFKGQVTGALNITGNNVTEGGIGVGETLNMLEFTGTIPNLNLSGNNFEGTYANQHFYSDSTATSVNGHIGGNVFLNKGGSGDCISGTKFIGRWQPNTYIDFVNQQLGEKKSTAVGAVAPGTMAAGAFFQYGSTAIGCLVGDEVRFGSIGTSWPIDLRLVARAYVPGTNVPRLELYNPTAAPIAVTAFAVWMQTTR